jgi:hypothetical protein
MASSSIEIEEIAFLPVPIGGWFIRINSDFRVVLNWEIERLKLKTILGNELNRRCAIEPRSRACWQPRRKKIHA